VTPPEREHDPKNPDPQRQGGLYFNRDLSWLEFNTRVIAQARDPDVPLLERVKFLAIASSNLDEFFMKRIGLHKLRAARHLGPQSAKPGDLPPAQILDESRRMIIEQERVIANLWIDKLRPALRDQGIRIVTYDHLNAHEQSALTQWYQREVFPILTPLAVDPGHRFPFISNLSLNLGVLVKPAGAPQSAEARFARIKVPDVLPRYLCVEDLVHQAKDPKHEPRPRAHGAPMRFIALHQIIAHNLEELFPGMTVIAEMPFRVTRSAAVELDDEDVEDLLEHVEEELRMRRFADAVRLETPPDPHERILDFILSSLHLTRHDHYTRPAPRAGVDLFDLVAIDRPDLKDTPWKPVRPQALADPEIDIFARIRDHDILLHHPYESFDDSVERFIAAAAKDPDVLAIKQTLYRTSRDSPFVDSLVRAAEEEKQVACLVELRARFDEEKNVAFARTLENAGVHVAYGVLGLKTHCKCSLVIRRENIEGRQALRAYAHFGTGNYHPGTAQLYTDIGLLTCDPEITEDAVRLFNTLTGVTTGQQYERLLVAPEHMRDRFIELIEREAKNARKGKHARIIAKMNQLEDRRITNALYEASKAGVQIDLIVRGFCCLRPGVAELSENIRVISIIGRFLEHSRIFYFASGSDDPLDGRYYISSADWMYRNLSSRVESACPVRDMSAKARLWSILDTHLRDHARAFELQPTGAYTRRTPPKDAPEDSPERLGTFETLMRAQTERADPR
jgi:polyphosphate kinase